MMYPLRTERPAPALSTPRVQLMLRTTDGRRWGVTFSEGMERFIGHYPRVPGLHSESPILDYRPVGCREDE